MFLHHEWRTVSVSGTKLSLEVTFQYGVSRPFYSFVFLVELTRSLLLCSVRHISTWLVRSASSSYWVPPSC